MTIKKIKLLIVDDDADDRYLIKDLLRNSALSFDIDETDSSNGALSKLKENRYDCALMDYIIPGLSGLEVLKAVRSMGKSVPIILVTGFGDWVLGEELIARGATDYITKEALTLENLQYKINAVVSEILPDDVKPKEAKLKDGSIGKLMHSPPLSVDSSFTLDQVISSINSHNVSSLLVKENSDFVGIVTTRDLIRKTIALKLQRGTTKVSDVMTKNILSLDKDAPVQAAYAYMNDHHIRHLAVAENKKIVGIVSITDLMEE